MIKSSLLYSNNLFVILLSGVILVAAQSSSINKDAKSGDSIKLDCRFDPNRMKVSPNTLVPMWQRIISDTQFEVIATHTHSFERSYKLEYSLNEGRYDLLIHSANYDRDNGNFVCIIKESGSGNIIKTVSYILTILIPPGQPRISPTDPIAKEGISFELKCLSEGGSPDPEIKWTKDDLPLDDVLVKGGRRNKPTSATLTIVPQMADDKSVYKCTVWNRAMNENEKLEKSVAIDVHYVPRIQVGPFNPLNVLEGDDALLTCTAKANPPVRSIEWYKSGNLISHNGNHTIIRVEPSDSGLYTCLANNGVTSNDDSERGNKLQLSVQYGPIVNMISSKEVTIGDTLSIRCNVDSEPKPYSIAWTKEGDSRVIETKDILVLEKITANDAGRYFCTARNKLRPSGSTFEVEKSGTSNIYIRVKHPPGDSEIMPAHPVAVAGKPFTLSCMTNPSGWPEPSFRWWKEDKDKVDLSPNQNYTFLSVHVSHEGKYSCQPYNQLGKGSIGSVYLTVQEAPSVIIPMPPMHKSKQGARGFSLTCRARGKPKPSITWLHNKEEVNVENGAYRVETKESIEDSSVYYVQSVLHFESASRNELTAMDKGKYECLFDNGVESSARSETYVRIEHSPVLEHTYNKVAFDIGETAILQCKMSAYPKPQFEWLFGSRPLDFGSRYQTNITEQANDLWVGTLVIYDIKASDYGDYTCRAWNSVANDDKKTNIKLVEKSPPEEPKRLEVVEILSDSVNLRWTEGFNGGFANTEFIVSYSSDGYRWKNESCRSINPCKIIGLESRKEYLFKVLAINRRGHSDFSEEVRAVTKVDLKDIPNAYEAYFDSWENSLTFRSEPTALKLLAKIEAHEGSDTETWSLITTSKIKNEYEKIRLRPSQNGYTDMRIILCLQSNDSWCGYPNLVKMDATSTYREATSFSAESIILIISIIVITAALLVTIFCCCYKKKDTNSKKDYEMDADNNPNKISSISPPYYLGHENKGLVNGSDDPSKISPPPMYSSATLNPNGNIPQNYYLTGDDTLPAPNMVNDTTNGESWMMKPDGYGDMITDNGLGYHSGYATTQMDPNGFTYSYYPHDEYQPLNNDNYNISVKNTLYSSYYDDGLTAYASTQRSGMMTDKLIDPQMLTPMDVSKMNHSFEDEPEYGASHGDKVIKEIIV